MTENTANDPETAKRERSCPDPTGSAFHRGWVAAEKGTVVGDNPYPEDSNHHWQWMNGWVNRKELNTEHTDASR